MTPPDSGEREVPLSAITYVNAEQWAAAGQPPLDDKKPREPGCKCHQEEGDSPCPVHGEEDDRVSFPLSLAQRILAALVNQRWRESHGPCPQLDALAAELRAVMPK